MDRTIPAGAAVLLNFIGNVEAPRGYDTIYGNNQGRLPKPITRMTLEEVQNYQPVWSRRYGSSASGRYQFMHATLKGLIKELRLRPGQFFDADLQDRLAFHLLKRRGYEQFMAGKMSLGDFAARLAMEWASLPVLHKRSGAHREITRGQSYYAGDGVNKALVSPEDIEKILEKAYTLGNGEVEPVLPIDLPYQEPGEEPVRENWFIRLLRWLLIRRQ